MEWHRSPRRLLGRDQPSCHYRPASRSSRGPHRRGRRTRDAPREPARPAPLGRADGLAAPRRGHGRLGRGGPLPDLRSRPVHRRRRLVAAGLRLRRGPRRGEDARHRPDQLRQLRLRRRPRRQRPGGAPHRRRHPARSLVGHRHRPGRAGGTARPRAPGRASRAAQRDLRRRGDERGRLGVRGRRRGRPDRVGRAGEGRAGARPGGHRRRRHRRALAVARARRELRDVLDLPRGPAVRRHPRAARTTRAWPGHLTGPRRHHPAYGRRRARCRTGRTAGPVVEGPRGARVRRALGRRLAGAVLLLHERARGARSCCTCPT